MIRLSKSACLEMLASAIETFPNECMGAVFSKGGNQAWFSIPYQIAKRSKESVISTSFKRVTTICGRDVKVLAEFHSHPYQSPNEAANLEPSLQDIKEIGIGKIEIIVRIYKIYRKEKWVRNGKGEIHAAIGKFRLQIRAFEKISHPKNEKQFDFNPELYYNRIPLKLSGR